MNELIFLGGFAQLSVLVASALVPIRLDWTTSLGSLPKLHRQHYWVYGGYVVLAIVANGLICIANADALADGSRLARCICGYLAVFWGIRLSLQTVLDAKERLTTWWLRGGYHLLTVLFASFTALFAYVTLR